MIGKEYKTWLSYSIGLILVLVVQLSLMAISFDRDNVGGGCGEGST